MNVYEARKITEAAAGLLKTVAVELRTRTLSSEQMKDDIWARIDSANTQILELERTLAAACIAASDTRRGSIPGRRRKV